MEKTITHDSVSPEGRWEFGQEVTDCFDEMLSRSIPGCARMRELCFRLGSRFVQQRTDVVDLGCSRGEAMSSFVDRFGAQNRHVGVEVSGPMLAACRERFRGFIECGVVEVRDDDLRRSYPPVSASLVLCVLTLQFVPIEHRQRLLRVAFDRLVEGGAFILVEKVLGSSHGMDSVLVEEYLAMKEANGYTRDQIDRKRLSLEGVLVPVTLDMNIQFLRSAGFSQVDGFWRDLNFAGLLAVKG